MSASSRSPDRFATTVDHEGLVANAGLILAGTLIARLGVSALIERWVRTGSANPGPKICTVVAAMLAGGTHIDHVGMLRAGRTGRVLGFRPAAPSTVRVVAADVHFGHVRQLEAVLSRTRTRLSGRGRRPPATSRWCSTGLHDLRGPRQTKTRSRVRLHQRARLSPAARCTRRRRAAARRPHAQRLRAASTSRGVSALRRRARREPATRRGRREPTTVRADSRIAGPTPELIDRLDAHDVQVVRSPWPLRPLACDAAIQAAPTPAWADMRLHQQRRPAQVADLTTYATGRGKAKRTGLVMRRDPPPEGAQQQPVASENWRHHAFITDTELRAAPPRTSSTAPTPSSSSPSATHQRLRTRTRMPSPPGTRTVHGSRCAAIAQQLVPLDHQRLAGPPPQPPTAPLACTRPRSCARPPYASSSGTPTAIPRRR